MSVPLPSRRARLRRRWVAAGAAVLMVGTAGVMVAAPAQAAQSAAGAGVPWNRTSLPGAAGWATPGNAGGAVVTVSGPNAGSSIPNPVSYDESSPQTVVRGAHLTRSIDSKAAAPDSITPADTSAFVPFSVAIDTVAPKVEIGVNGTGQRYRIWVDGHPLSADPSVTPTGGASYRLIVSFPVRALREIRFESDAVHFAAFTVSAADQVTAAAPAGIRAAVIGDSFTEGTGANGRFESWAYQFCARAGWDDCWSDGSGGTGYFATGGSFPGRTDFADRFVHDVLPYHPAVVVVAGGKNDQPWTPDQLRSQALALFTTIRKALPEATLIVTGLFPSSGGQATGAAYAQRDAALESAARAAGAAYFLDVDGPDSYMTGTGNAGRPRGDGTADTYTMSDGVHPTPAGHAALAAALFGKLATAIATSAVTTAPIVGTPTASVVGTPTTTSGPTVVRATALADTYTLSSGPNNNFGQQSSLGVYGSPVGTALLRFGLSPVAGRVAVRVSLTLHTTTLGSAGSANLISVRTVSGGWDENTTYPTRPTLGTAVLGTFTAPAADTAYTVDLDPVVADGAVVDLALTGSGTDGLWLWSREYPSVAGRPTLTVTYR